MGERDGTLAVKLSERATHTHANATGSAPQSTVLRCAAFLSLMKPEGIRTHAERFLFAHGHTLTHSHTLSEKENRMYHFGRTVQLSQRSLFGHRLAFLFFSFLLLLFLLSNRIAVNVHLSPAFSSFCDFAQIQIRQECATANLRSANHQISIHARFRFPTQQHQLIQVMIM